MSIVIYPSLINMHIWLRNSVALIVQSQSHDLLISKSLMLYQISGSMLQRLTNLSLALNDASYRIVLSAGNKSKKDSLRRATTPTIKKQSHTFILFQGDRHLTYSYSTENFCDNRRKVILRLIFSLCSVCKDSQFHHGCCRRRGRSPRS